ncbi:MAG: polyprenyl synthetase family protein [Duodenibacillus sp.]|nr:polyprenyl synthetase family protein [Duodenibacillus sp.]
MAAVNKIIADEMASDIGRVQDIARYITGAGGKRMRPALLILMARAMGCADGTPPYFGAVIEILHTATLMHDDVVDEGMMRRGRATANAQWGNAQAVLVGDFLYTRSFQMMVKGGNLKVMQALSDAANRLSEGEVLQLANAHDPGIDERSYFAVIERKTACLFEAAAHMAAAVAHAPQDHEDACAAYARALGNAFQIVDDVLDYRGDAAVTGKNLGADLREGKVTLPVLYAMQRAAPADAALIAEAIRKGDGDFAAISRIVSASGALEAALERARREVEAGKAALAVLPPSIFRETLIKFLALTVTRDQ